MSESLSVKAFRLLNILTIPQINRSEHYNATHYGDTSTSESLNEISENIEGNFKDYENLVNIMAEIRDKGQYAELFTILESNDLPLDILLPICAKFLTKHNRITLLSVRLYAILLGFRPLVSNYNEHIIQKILHSIIKASKFVEMKKDISDNEIYYVTLADIFFNEFSYAISQEFIDIASKDVFIAFIEIAFKIGSSLSKQILQIVPKIDENIIKFINASIIVHADYVAPYIIPIFVTDSLPKNVRIQRFREKITNSIVANLQGHDALLTLMCKHLAVRCPDRAFMKELVSGVVKELFNVIIDKSPFLNYLKKCVKSVKVSLRCVSLEIIASILPYLQMEFITNLINMLKAMTKENNASIKSAAINVISRIVQVTHNPGFFDVLEYSLIDERVAVRKSSLNLLQKIIQNCFVLDTKVLKFLSDRTRDKSIVIRQESMTILDEYFQKYPSIESFKVLLESILPRTLDDDKKIMTLAIQILETTFFSDINLSYNFSSVFDENIVESIRSCLGVIWNISNHIKPFAKLVAQKLNADVSPGFWALADAISEYINAPFNYNILEGLWEKRFNITHYFLSICTRYIKENSNKRNSQNTNSWIDDAMKNVEMIAKGRLECNFGHIKYLVEIAAANESNLEDFRQLMEKCLNSTMRKSIQRNNSCSIVFLIGCLAQYVSVESVQQISTLIDVCYDKNIDEKIRAIGIISLTKCSLTKKEVAKDMIVLMSNDLLSDTKTSIKMNEVTGLGDLLIKFGNFETIFIDHTLKLLINGESILKRHILIELTKLIREDYLKIKDVLFFKLLKVLTDNDPDIVSLASSCIFDVIVAKSPKILVFLPDSVSFYNSPEVGIFHLPVLHRRKIFDDVIMRMTDIQCWQTILSLINKYIENYRNHDLNHMRDAIIIIGDCYQKIISGYSGNKEVVIDQDSESQENDIQLQNRDKIQKLYLMMQQQIIKVLLPKMVEVLNYHRQKNSPLQTDLIRMMSNIVKSDNSFLQYIEMIDMQLSRELKAQTQRADDEEESIPPSPVMKRMFSSSLLTRLAARNSPMRQTQASTQNAAQSQSQEELSILIKRIPRIDDDE